MVEKILLDIRDGVVTPEQSRTNVGHTFLVEEAYESLEISYNYTPKKVYDQELCQKEIVAGIMQYAPDLIPEGETETLRQTLLDNWEDNIPMLNHITLSVQQGESYLGAAHRHDSVQEHRIGPDFSSPGFVRTQVCPGQWRVTLNVHAALCEVHYSLMVVGKRGCR